MSTSIPEFASDPKALLDAANSASEKVAVLHIAFLALCAYILVIVFGTTDMDLVVGKGVRLPVVDVEVPIVGFYATAPYLLLLVHFNLLLQLQLLSRKLFAFDAAAPKYEGIGGLHDQLNIFPYNYYLVGRPSGLVRALVTLLVTMTILILPLVAMLMLQARFLAYQSEAVTWAQRAAPWLDVVIVVALWPVIMDRRDSWSDYFHGVRQRATRHWLRWAWGLLGFAILMLLLVVNDFSELSDWLPFAFVAWLLVTLIALPFRLALRRLSRGRYFAVARTVEAPLMGVPGLLMTILLGVSMPFLLVIDGESLDGPTALRTLLLRPVRHLDLREQILLAKPAKPEIVADLRGTDAAKRETALRAIERIDLQFRSLRRADLRGALLMNADLRNARLQAANLENGQLQGADLSDAQLQGAQARGAQLQAANLGNAQLQVADLWGARLQGADLRHARLQGAQLVGAQLQGADLSGAQLQGADLRDARLQGAQLRNAQLQVANLENAQLQGADLSGAQLQGADLRGVKLLGTDLRSAQLYGATEPLSPAEMVDARELIWRPLNTTERQWLEEDVSPWLAKDSVRVRFGPRPPAHWGIRRPDFIARVQMATASDLTPPEIESCLRDEKTQLSCKHAYSLAEFRSALLAVMEKLACTSNDIAHGILRRYVGAEQPEPKGLALHLEDRIKKGVQEDICPGLVLLKANDKELLRHLARADSSSQ